jgi:hypothetical protein
LSVLLLFTDYGYLPLVSSNSSSAYIESLDVKLNVS